MYLWHPVQPSLVSLFPLKKSLETNTSSLTMSIPKCLPLNSAYFVYNAKDPAILEFQQQRYAVLQEVKNYEGEPNDFMEYYTRMPEGPTFKRISDLADSLTAGTNTPLDKVLAIRDYFLSKDENGDALFTYTLTPGSPTDPNIPDAALLSNFLFSTQKGYCTYFATSSLFMLRSLGIPVRMASRVSNG